MLIFGNLTIALWIVVGTIACWLFNPIVGWLFLTLVFILIFGVLRKLGCSFYYYCKSCAMGFRKLADLFFGSGYTSSVDASVKYKIVFAFVLLGMVPIAFLAVSIMQEPAVIKIAVLALLLFLLFYSGNRRPRSQNFLVFHCNST